MYLQLGCKIYGLLIVVCNKSSILCRNQLLLPVCYVDFKVCLMSEWGNLFLEVLSWSAHLAPALAFPFPFVSIWLGTQQNNFHIQYTHNLTWIELGPCKTLTRLYTQLLSPYMILFWEGWDYFDILFLHIVYVALVIISDQISPAKICIHWQLIFVFHLL